MGAPAPVWVWGCLNPLSPHPSPCSLCPAMAWPSQAGALGGQQSQQAGNRLWKHRRGVTCWAVGHSLDGLGCTHCRSTQVPLQDLWAGDRRVLGSISALLTCPFAAGRSYNQSCDMDGPSSCCTLDHIPLVR